jgi:hypothetical protein
MHRNNSLFNERQIFPAWPESVSNLHAIFSYTVAAYRTRHIMMEMLQRTTVSTL